MQIQPFLLDDGLALGTVYGTLLNQQATVQRLSPQFDSAPYKAAPRAPVLYLKPRNTWARDGAASGRARAVSYTHLTLPTSDLV